MKERLVGQNLLILELAKELGTKLVVIVNNDYQCELKKGESFMKELDRLKIVKSLSVVDKAFLSIDRDRTVCNSLAAINPDIFANGGDRKAISDIPEHEICKKNNIWRI